jgi:hypothetical protein
MNKRLQHILFVIIILIIVIVNALRFFKLSDVPMGYHVDESSSALTVRCLGTEGVDSQGVRYPFFSDFGYGTPKPFLYMYPAVVWTKFFGYSIASFRAYSAAWMIVGLVGLFLLATLFWGLPYALWVALAASLSPWTWCLSRLSIEAMLAPALLSWGLFFFFRSTRWHQLILSGVILSLAMYSYPATRVHAPLLLLPLIVYRFHRGGFSKKHLLFFLFAFTVTTIPLLVKIISDPGMTLRFKSVGIFSTDYLKSIGKTASFWDLTTVFLKGYLTHFRPSFLFTRGDANMTYSTRWCGIFSWMDIAGLIAGLLMMAVHLTPKKFPWRTVTPTTAFLTWLVVNYLLGIIPSALTWDEIPDLLRMIGSWPFLMLITGYVFWRLSESWAPSGFIACALATAFACGYLHHYFLKYPQTSARMFFVWVRQEAESCRNETDWTKFLLRHHRHNLQTRYYLMTYHGDSCSLAREKVRAAFRITGEPVPDN